MNQDSVRKAFTRTQQLKPLSYDDANRFLQCPLSERWQILGETDVELHEGQEYAKIGGTTSSKDANEFINTKLITENALFVPIVRYCATSSATWDKVPLRYICAVYPIKN